MAGRRESEEDTRRDRDERREEEYRTVEPDFGEPGQVPGTRGLEQVE